MKQRRYDIFISYRRKDAGEKAEHLKDLLDQSYRNRISFDRENLTGKFAPKLIKRIDNCMDFLLVIARDSFRYEEKDFAEEKVELYKYLATCSQEDFETKIEELGANADLDFVRIEVARALQRKNLNIIPIVPQSTESFKFASLNLPPDIANIKSYEAIFYSDNADALFKDVVPKLKPHLKSRPDIPMKGLVYSAIALVIVALAVFGGWKYNEIQIAKEKVELQESIITCMEERGMDKVLNQGLNLSSEISIEQLQVIKGILCKMILVEGGTFMQGAAPYGDGSYSDEVCPNLETPQMRQTVETFYMAQYEVSVKEWCEIMGREYATDSSLYPMTHISFEECTQFTEALHNLTMLNFSIPTEAQWEYAARGGNYNENTTFAGSNEPEKVAWFANNSQGMMHICDATNYSIDPNALDLFNMSGNVCEWCSTLFKSYNPQVINIDPTARVIRGGAFDSEAYEVAVYHRCPMKPSASAANVGLRLILTK